MVMLVSSMGNIFSNCYHLYNLTTDSGNRCDPAHRAANKREAIEQLTLGLLKLLVFFSIYSALYVANVYLKNWEKKGAVLACAFCIHPLAAIDFPMIQGIFEVYTSTFVMINKSGKEVNKIVDTIKKQVEKEGFQLRDFWGKCPPKTHQRCVELLTIAQRDNPEVKKIFESFKFTLNQVKELLIQGFKKLGTSCVVEMIVVNWSTHLAPLFWLDRQLANVSKWVASRFV